LRWSLLDAEAAVGCSHFLHNWRITMRFLTVAVLLLVLAGCSSSTPPPTNQALGGFWRGTDGDGLAIQGLSTDDGRLHWQMGIGTGTAPQNPAPFPFPLPVQPQAFGTISAIGSAVTINYTLVVPRSLALSDGSTSAICAGTGTIEQRQSLTVSVDCVTSLGAEYSDSILLRHGTSVGGSGSALMVVVGNYEQRNSILNISGNGVIFEQDPATGCVINGQVGIIDAQFNVYDISLTYSNCLGNRAVLNGTTHVGLATYFSNEAIPELPGVPVLPNVFFLLLTGEVDGVIVSSILLLIRT